MEGSSPSTRTRFSEATTVRIEPDMIAVAFQLMSDALYWMPTPPSLPFLRCSPVHHQSLGALHQLEGLYHQSVSTCSLEQGSLADYAGRRSTCYPKQTTTTLLVSQKAVQSIRTQVMCDL